MVTTTVGKAGGVLFVDVPEPAPWLIAAETGEPNSGIKNNVKITRITVNLILFLLFTISSSLLFFREFV